jgi:hypothetical protein
MVVVHNNAKEGKFNKVVQASSLLYGLWAKQPTKYSSYLISMTAALKCVALTSKSGKINKYSIFQ